MSRMEINWMDVFRYEPLSRASPAAGRSAAAAGLAKIDWADISGSSSSAYCDVCRASSLPIDAALCRGRVSGPGQGDPALRGGLGRRVGDRAQVKDRALRSVTRPASKVAAARAFYGSPAADNVVDSDGEDKLGDESVAFKYCLDSSHVLARKKNHGQADDVGERGATSSAKKDDKEAAPPEEIFEALIAIPGLARVDLQRAYSSLIRDDRQFRSLVALPKNMRKDWLLMEIGNQ